MQTLDQRLANLDTANRVRMVRASLKRNVAGMTRPSALEFVAEIIEENPEELRTMPVADLLGAIPKVGRGKAARLMRESGIPYHARVGQLTVRQRQNLARKLGFGWV